MRNKVIWNRDNFILDKCKNKRVLHIGATDSPYTKIKMEEDNLLYQKIDEICSKQLGIDVDSDGVQILNNMSTKKSYCTCENVEDFESDNPFDIIIFGETLEHVENPGKALESLKKLMTKETELVISVPNFLNLSKALYALAGKEREHPDHKQVYSIQTLSETLEQQGLNVKQIGPTFLPRETLGKANIMNIIFAWIFPIYSENIIATASINNASQGGKNNDKE